MSRPIADPLAPDDSSNLEARFVAGDTVAFEALFRRWQADVFRWALRIVRDRSAAEDVTADAFWRAYRGRARFDATRSFGAWMRRIVTNAALDHLARQRPEEVAAAPRVEAAAGDDAVGREIRDSVAVALARLRPSFRVVITLGLIEDRPYAEIADALDISVAAVKVRMFRATRALRRELLQLGVR